MEERLFMALFNVFILGIILLFQLYKGRITNNMLLGIKVPQNRVNSDKIKMIKRGYRKESIIVGIVTMAIMFGVNYFLENLMYFIGSIFIYLLILFVIYLRWHRKTKELRKKENWDKVLKKQSFEEKYGKSDSISKKWFLIPLSIILLNIIIALFMYPILPNKLPIRWDFKGNISTYMDKSIIGVLLIPIMQLFLGVVIYLSYYAIKKSKKNKNPRDPEGSLRKNIIFRKVWSWYFILTLTLVEILLTILNMMTFGFIKNIQIFNFFSFVITGLIIVGAIILSIIMGQGGDRLKVNDEEILNEKNRDDEFWKLGNLIYFNPDDPTIFIEKRVGLGWTVNLGRPSGVVLMVFPIIILIIALIFTR